MGSSAQDIIGAAGAEAARMKATVHDADQASRISMSANQFGKLAQLIEALCQLRTLPSSDGFGDPRYWVPLDVFQRDRATLRSLERECRELRSAAMDDDGSRR